MRSVDDPSEMTADELAAKGYERVSPLKAIRRHCIDCSGGSKHEVKLCPSACDLRPYRMGSDPWRRRTR